MKSLWRCPMLWLPLALSLADYVYVMNKGAIVYGGSPDELSNSPDVQATYLGV